jgi:transposase
MLRHRSAKRLELEVPKEESVSKHMTIAVDIAKSVFEIAVSEQPGRVRERRRCSRAQMMSFFRKHEAATVVLEACGAAHQLGRELGGMGHVVRLLPPKHVRRYVLGNKTDRADATALLEANRNEQIMPVPVKTEAQQVLSAIHRMRSGWIRTRTARLNLLRGVLRELGVTIPVGAAHVAPRVVEALGSDRIAPAIARLLTSVLAEVRQIEESISEAERELKMLAKELESVRRLETIPGIGLLTATALVASIGEPSRFQSGRRLAAFVGLVPREHSSGERRRLGSITKRGDRYLRTLLTHGARSVLLAAARRRAKGVELDRLQSWGLSICDRRGHNRAAVAVASKITRLAWAVWSRQDIYRSEAHRPAGITTMTEPTTVTM